MLLVKIAIAKKFTESAAHRKKMAELALQRQASLLKRQSILL